MDGNNRTAAPDYGAMYRQSQEDLECAKREVDWLKDENYKLRRKEQEFDTVLRTLEFIFGRKFYDA